MPSLKSSLASGEAGEGRVTPPKTRVFGCILKTGRCGCPIPKRAAGAALECFGMGHPHLCRLAQGRRRRLAAGCSWRWQAAERARGSPRTRPWPLTSKRPLCAGAKQELARHEWPMLVTSGSKLSASRRATRSKEAQPGNARRQRSPRPRRTRPPWLTWKLPTHRASRFVRPILETAEVPWISEELRCCARWLHLLQAHRIRQTRAHCASRLGEALNET